MISDTLFKDTKTAFSLKNEAELRRAYLLFKMMSYPSLVRIGTSVANFALKTNLPVKGVIRATVFDHFCGGVNEEDCLPAIDKLYTKGVSSVLDYSVEGKEEEAQFDEAADRIVNIINFSLSKKAIPIVVFKPTGFGRFNLFQKKGEEGRSLTDSEKEEWSRVVERYKRVCALAKEKNVKVLIDGEESWMQDAADDLAEDMMRLYNTETPIVYNTLQTYRWDRLAYLKEIHQRSVRDGFKLGFKIVRGAYMEKERERAEEKGYTSPICKDKAATDTCFNDSMTYILNNLEDVSVFIGTHNEESTLMALRLMEEFKVSKNSSKIWFGQLYGMSDHISFNLSQKGYNVAKYVPFGPVKDVMPYLIRRAEENTSVAGQTSRELDLIEQERKRRKLK